MNNLLTCRQYDTRDFKALPHSWYAPLQLFERYKSVQYAYHTNTGSSAGDWEGFIVQKIGKRSYVIMFSQENNWPYAGYTIYTSTFPSLSFVGEMSRDEICKALYQDD